MPDNHQIPEPEHLLLASMRAELDRLQAANKGKFAEFARLAGPPGLMGMQLDLLNVRVFTLARMVFGDASPDLVQFQIAFERQVAEVLEEAVSKVRQAQLGAQLSPQAMQQALRSQGLLGPDGKPVRPGFGM
jgi:hypothetical protein